MNYIILEAQTTNGTTAIITPVVKATYNEAEQEYHTKLAAAAVSNIALHSVTMLNERGQVVKYEVYDHSEQAEE